MARVVDKILLGKPKEKYWITYIKQRIKRNKNFLGFISGQTGSGKSWTSLSICEQLDPKFNIDNIVFGGIELMNLINSGKLKSGSCICFEEVGVEMGNRNWASVTNKMLSYLMQTFRHKRFILIMNSPYMDYVDSAARKLFHAEMQTISINDKAKTCKIKPMCIQYNSRNGKTYYKFLRVVTEGSTRPLRFWNVKKASQNLIDSYELKKSEYTTNLNKRILSELKRFEKKSLGIKELTLIQQETLDMIKKGLSLEQMSKLKDVNVRNISERIRAMRKKGVNIVPSRLNGTYEVKYTNDIQNHTV